MVSGRITCSAAAATVAALGFPTPGRRLCRRSPPPPSLRLRRNRGRREPPRPCCRARSREPSESRTGTSRLRPDRVSAPYVRDPGASNGSLERQALSTCGPAEMTRKSAPPPTGRIQCVSRRSGPRRGSLAAETIPPRAPRGLCQPGGAAAGGHGRSAVGRSNHLLRVVRLGDGTRPRARVTLPSGVLAGGARRQRWLRASFELPPASGWRCLLPGSAFRWSAWWSLERDGPLACGRRCLLPGSASGGRLKPSTPRCARVTVPSASPAGGARRPNDAMGLVS